MYEIAFLVCHSLPLSSLMAQILRRIGALPFQLSPNFWRVFGDITYLNYTQSLDLGISKLFNMYALMVVDS